jgi:chromosome segregation ATPase
MPSDLVAWIGALVAALAAGAALSQAQHAKTQAGAAQRQATSAENQATSAKDQATSAKDQVTEAKEQVAVAREQAKYAKDQAESAQQQAQLAARSIEVAEEQLRLAGDQLSELRQERTARQDADRLAAFELMLRTHGDVAREAMSAIQAIHECFAATASGKDESDISALQRRKMDAEIATVRAEQEAVVATVRYSAIDPGRMLPIVAIRQRLMRMLSEASAGQRQKMDEAWRLAGEMQFHISGLAGNLRTEQEQAPSDRESS